MCSILNLLHNSFHINGFNMKSGKPGRFARPGLNKMLNVDLTFLLKFKYPFMLRRGWFTFYVVANL